MEYVGPDEEVRCSIGLGARVPKHPLGDKGVSSGHGLEGLLGFLETSYITRIATDGDDGDEGGQIAGNGGFKRIALAKDKISKVGPGVVVEKLIVLIKTMIFAV